jgi:hypothetical protein
MDKNENEGYSSHRKLVYSNGGESNPRDVHVIPYSFRGFIHILKGLCHETLNL